MRGCALKFGTEISRAGHKITTSLKLKTKSRKNSKNNLIYSCFASQIFDATKHILRSLHWRRFANKNANLSKLRCNGFYTKSKFRISPKLKRDSCFRAKTITKISQS